MQYMIMNYVPAASADGEPAPHNDMEAWSACTKALIDAGVMRGGTH